MLKYKCLNIGNLGYLYHGEVPVVSNSPYRNLTWTISIWKTSSFEIQHEEKNLTTYADKKASSASTIT